MGELTLEDWRDRALDAESKIDAALPCLENAIYYFSEDTPTGVETGVKLAQGVLLGRRVR